MKKIILFLLITLTSISIEAQTKGSTTIHLKPVCDTSLYDTVLIFQPPQLQGCVMYFDTNYKFSWPADTTIWPAEGPNPADTDIFPHEINYTNLYGLGNYDRYQRFCKHYNQSIEGWLIGYNIFNPKEFAQPYHLDSAALICGIATQMYGAPAPYTNYFHIMDTNFNVLSSATIFDVETHDMNGNLVTPWYGRYNLHPFYFDSIVLMQDFYLSAEVDGGTAGPIFNYSCSLADNECLRHVNDSLGFPYDTIFVGKIFVDYMYGTNDTTKSNIIDTAVCCHSNISPWIKRIGGQWTKFDDDSVYFLYKDIFIEFLPIILVPKPSSITEVELNNRCYVYPNPAHNLLNVLCNYKIKSIEIINMQGQKLIEEEINNFSSQINVNNLNKGDYIIRLNTVKGIVNKKFIKQ
jgi:hypothetical protein